MRQIVRNMEMKKEDTLVRSQRRRPIIGVLSKTVMIWVVASDRSSFHGQPGPWRTTVLMMWVQVCDRYRYQAVLENSHCYCCKQVHQLRQELHCVTSRNSVLEQQSLSPLLFHSSVCRLSLYPIIFSLRHNIYCFLLHFSHLARQRTISFGLFIAFLQRKWCVNSIFYYFSK